MPRFLPGSLSRGHRSIGAALVVTALAVLTPAIARAQGARCDATRSCVADLSVSAAVPSAPLRLGAVGELTLTVANAGPDVAEDVTLDVTPPGELSVVSAKTAAGAACQIDEGQDISCPLGSIAVGQAVTVRVDVRAGVVGVYHVPAGVSADGAADPDMANDQVDPTWRVLAPTGGIATIRTLAPQRILRTGGVSVRLLPKFTGFAHVAGYVTTPSGRVPLTAVDIRESAKSVARTVFLGTTPSALSRIRRALRGHTSLAARVSVTIDGVTTTRALRVLRS